VLVCVLSQTPSQIIVSHAMTFSFAGLVSFYGAQTYRRLIGAEKKAHQERLEALEHLAESERRRVQAERTRAELERLALVGQLASGVAHEVNNPLAFVKANLRYLHEELIEHPGPLSPAELRTVLEETEQGVLRIQQIVSDLRQFSREVTEDEACAVPEALEEALRLAPERLPGLGEVVRELAPGLPQVRMGQRHLVQVVLNLLDNAMGAMQSTESRRPPRIVLRAREDSGGVRLDIEDNGPGIPADVLPRLFEPFFTTRYNSKGLGLALCREHAVRAGGSLVAENLPGGGARFVLRLPGAGQARRASGE
jgi:C4-dicarboxylate-specific signal transduction histidine kinase